MQSTHDRCLCTTDVNQTAMHDMRSTSRQRSVHRIENGPSYRSQQLNMADNPTNSARGCDKVPTVPRCTKLITAQPLKYGHTSRKTPADTQCCRRCQTKPAKYQTGQIVMRCQLWEAPCFYPTRDGGHQQPVFILRPRTAAEPRTRTETTKRRGHGHRETEDHAAQKPRSRDRAAGQKDQPDLSEKQKMRTTRGSSMQPALKNSRTVTPFRPSTPWTSK